jgi:hypothetical protein
MQLLCLKLKNSSAEKPITHIMSKVRTTMTGTDLKKNIIVA